ncbi:MAG: TraU family protein, partial [Holosporaceae bacterium]|nr:TraU family protein [Holosporaceae bacterium]
MHSSAGFVIGFLLIFFVCECGAKCVGRFVNPMTDICWSCLFPITICGMKVSPGGEDISNPKKIICQCPAPPPLFVRYGLPISFWEPVRLIDVTRTKFCLVNMGGISIGGDSIRGHGNVASGNTSNGTKHSFYQVHYYVYPVLYWLELLTDFVCMERSQFDVAYITEFDPLWNDDETAFILNPEAAIFANPIAQAACAADAIAATAGFPLDAMFWCAGCQGSIYPYTGNVNYHISGVQASLLLVTRMLAKLHRECIAHGTIGEAGMCSPYLMPIMMKSQYKQQMLYPSATTGSGGRASSPCCKPLGRTDVI